MGILTQTMAIPVIETLAHMGDTYPNNGDSCVEAIYEYRYLGPKPSGPSEDTPRNNLEALLGSTGSRV